MAGYDQIEQEIVSVVYRAGATVRKPYNAAQWTRQIKIHVGKAGQAFGYSVCTAGLPMLFDNEWLYDLMWYVYNSSKELLDVPLVLECEWGNYTHIKYDFEKLLLARSRYKVMVFQEVEDNINPTLEKLIGIIKACRLTQKGDRYLLFAVGKAWGEIVDRHLVV